MDIVNGLYMCCRNIRKSRVRKKIHCSLHLKRHIRVLFQPEKNLPSHPITHSKEVALIVRWTLGVRTCGSGPCLIYLFFSARFLWYHRTADYRGSTGHPHGCRLAANRDKNFVWRRVMIPMRMMVIVFADFPSFPKHQLSALRGILHITLLWCTPFCGFRLKNVAGLLGWSTSTNTWVVGITFFFYDNKTIF